jgi:hypothetical protein
MKTRSGLLAVLILISLCGCGSNKFDLSDRAARGLVQDYVDKQKIGEIIWLGHMIVLTPLSSRQPLRLYGIDTNKNVVELSLAGDKFYQKLESESLVSITNVLDRTKSFGGWDSFWTLAARG